MLSHGSVTILGGTATTGAEVAPGERAPISRFRRPTAVPARHKHRQRGGSVLELSLMMPWFAFLFVGAFDWGFYAHALISTESAARVAALYTSTSSTTASDQTTACTLALQELSVAANVPSSGTCTSLPVIVTATAVTGADNQPASEVTVTYQSLSLIPIPGLLASQVTFKRTTQMRLRN